MGYFMNRDRYIDNIEIYIRQYVFFRIIGKCVMGERVLFAIKIREADRLPFECDM